MVELAMVLGFLAVVALAVLVIQGRPARRPLPEEDWEVLSRVDRPETEEAPAPHGTAPAKAPKRASTGFWEAVDHSDTPRR